MPTYKAYGLTINSDITLPALEQLAAPDATSAADIVFEEGRVPVGAGGANKFRNWEAGPGRFMSHFFEVGRFLVTDGNSVLYHRETSADDTQIVSVLLGTCLGAALMQRRILPIHSCCVLTDKGAVLVMGRSGAGKSTTLGGLLELGLPMMADDVTGLTISDSGVPMAIPAFPSIRLWQDSLKTLGHTPQGLAKVRSDMEKFYLPSGTFHDRPEPIRGIAYISASNASELSCEGIAPAHKVESLSRFIFRKNFIDGMEMRRFAFQTVADAVNELPMVRIVRPAQAVPPRKIAETILRSLELIEAGNAFEPAR